MEQKIFSSGRSRKELVAIRAANAARRYGKLTSEAFMGGRFRAAEHYSEQAIFAAAQQPQNDLPYLVAEEVALPGVSILEIGIETLETVLGEINEKLDREGAHNLN